MKDLVKSNIERQNVLNNRYAVESLKESIAYPGMEFMGDTQYTKKMVADFYEVEERTIERLTSEYEDELKQNGYLLCRGNLLREFKLQFAPDINVGSKTTQMAFFNFRAFLNIGMLLQGSEKAKRVRSLILDTVIAVLNQRCGGMGIVPLQKVCHYETQQGKLERA